jgi:ElaB/YqjD/DUF883 family membrane-anchored ribosome-binding protein
MKNQIIAVLLLLVAPISLLFSDDEADIAHALQFLPDKPYDQIGFLDMDAARKTPAFGVFTKLSSQGGGFILRSLPPLPDSFVDETLWLVSATLSSVESDNLHKRLAAKSKSIRKELKADSEKAKEKAEKQLQHLEKEYRAIFESSQVWIVCLNNPLKSVNKALETGIFAETGEKVGGKPVYSISNKAKGRDGERGSDTFAVIADTGELLVTKTRELLAEMMACANGAELSVMDNQHYVASLQSIEPGHQGWQLEPKSAAAKRKATILSQSGAEEDKIAAMETKAETGIISEIQSVLLTEEILVRKKSEYFERAEAEKAHKEMVGTMSSVKSSMKDARKEINKQEAELSEQERKMAKRAMGFAGNLLNNNTITLEKNTVITDIVFSKKQLGTLTMLLDFAEAMEKQQKNEENNKQ